MDSGYGYFSKNVIDEMIDFESITKTLFDSNTLSNVYRP